MNDVDARGVPVYGGFHGEFREVHKSKWEKVCKAGIPQIYDTKDEAEVAAWRALRAHLCGIIRREGPVGDLSTRSKAEELFGAIIKRGRKITVERKHK